MLRILLLAPDSNPDGTHGSLIGYSHAEALAQLHAVTFVSMPGVFDGSLGIILPARL